jgi:PAS domain S-box-containing protein
MLGRLSLRERLVVLMLAALLPVLGLSLWMALRETHSSIELVQTQLRFSASLVAAHQDRAVDGAEQLLGAIAAVPDLRAMGRARCQAYFENLHERYPMYTNIGLVDMEGHAVCHANAKLGDASVGDRDYFRNAVSARRFVMGEPIAGRLTGRMIIPFAMPVLEHGNVAGVVFAALDLDSLSASLARVELPPGARVLMADRHGHALIEFPPQPGMTLPRTITEPALLEAAQSLTSGVGERKDGAGTDRVFAFAPSRPVGTEAFVVRVGLDRTTAVEAATARRRDVLLVLALAMIAAVTATTWIGGRVIVKPAKQILGTVRRLEQGRLDARVPMLGASQRDEFTRIGASFNLMAESLQLRQRELEAELGRSRAAYSVLDLVLNSMHDGVIAATAAGQVLMYNEAAAKMFPLEATSRISPEWPARFGLFHPDGVTPYEANDLPLARAVRGESGRQHLMVVRNALVPQGRLIQCSWQPIRSDGGPQGGMVIFTDVTELERLQAEQAAQFEQLRAAQAKLVEAQRLGRMGNWEMDLASGRLWWSEEVHELFGVARDDFDGTLNSFVQRVHPDDRALLKPARDSALRDGKVMNVEYRVVRPDGGVVWMHEIAQARRNEHGDPVWFGGVVQDVTARKQGEQALLASERELQQYTQMLQRAAEAAQAITSQPSLQATLQTVADQARQVIGTQHAMIDLVARGEEEALRHASASAQPELFQEGELRVALVGRDGNDIGALTLQGKREGAFTQRDEYVALEIAQLASIAIENVCLFSEIRDLNAGLEARIAERTAELARQERLYRALAEQAPEVVWNTDASGERLTFLNRAWYDLVGGTPQDWIGKSGIGAIHPDDRAEVGANWLRSRKTLETFTGVRRVLARDGTYHTMSYKAVPVLDESGGVTFWVGIDADVTELKSIEQALRSSNQELEAFSYSVSHDLRAPLGAIGGFARALDLKLEGHSDEKARHYLARIQAAVEKMEQLIDAMLSLAKVVRAPLHHGPVDLSATAREVIEGLRMQHPGRSVEAKVQDGLVAQGDARLLRVALENLLGNAWKFTSRREDARIEVGKVDGASVFFVRDNGVGFDMAYAGKLFSAFQRLHTEAEFPGTGIGLATVRRIVARHQGRAWAESHPGEGTTFFFALSEAAPPAWLAERVAEAEK